MTKPLLFDYYRSSAAYRVRIALNLKGVEYESISINLASGEQKEADYRERNPQGFVPMLEVNGVRLTQSLAIIDYVDTAFAGARLIPADPMDRAHVMAMALTIACDVHPLNNLRILKYLVGSLGQDEVAKNEWIAHWITEGFAALELMAAERSGRFLFGDEPTIADVCLVPQIYNARRFDVPLDAFPTLVRVDAEAANLKAFAAAHPDRLAPPA